jgi:signal peptide peptidase SppA
MDHHKESLGSPSPEPLESPQRKRPDCRVVRPGELLAMHPAAIRSGPQGFFWMLGGGIKSSERKGRASIVYVRGELDHHDDSWGENYESIVTRVRDAMTGDDEVSAHKKKQVRHEWMAGHRKDYRPLPDIEQTKPSAVVLSIDSPGGVVSGLNETVAKLRQLKKEHGVKLIAYTDEMAASAAYALTTACDRVYCPKSAIIGSIGVISTMVSMYRRNKEDGIDVKLITSGDRKADGHVLAPLTKEMVDIERGRVMKLAKEFWGMVAEARGLSVAKVSSLQAGIFLGDEAVAQGLADRVVSLDAAVESINGNASRMVGGNETDRRESIADVKRNNLTHLGSAWQAGRMAHIAQRRS